MRPTRRRFHAVAFLVFAVAGSEASSLELQIRVPTRCELSIERVDGELAASVVVRDDRGRPVPELRLRLELAPEATPSESPSLSRRGASTGPGGRALFTGLGLSRSTLLRLDFVGDDRHGACSARRRVDPRKSFPRLALTGPRRVREGEAKTVAFEARTDAIGATLRARLWRGERWDEIAVGASDAAGGWRFDLDGAHRGGLGPATLRLELLEDARRNGASIDRTVTLTRAASVSLRAPSEAPLDGALALSGELRAGGRPVGDAAVAIVFEGGTVAIARTRASGAYSVEVAAAKVGEGLHSLQAVFVPALAGLEGAASRAQRLKILPGLGLGRRLLVVLAVVGALGLLAALVAGLAALRRARSAGLAAAQPSPLARALAPVRRAWRRMTATRVVRGRVVDARTGAPLALARIVAGSDETLSDEEGRFRLGPLEGSVAKLRAHKDGFAEASVTHALPSEDDVAFRLWSWREALLRAFSALLPRIVPGAPLGERTLRDVRREAGCSGAADAPRLAALAEKLERACYGEGLLDAESFARLRAEVDALARALPAIRSERAPPAAPKSEAVGAPEAAGTPEGSSP